VKQPGDLDEDAPFRGGLDLNLDDLTRFLTGLRSLGKK
jgi:hypothetical protein